MSIISLFSAGIFSMRVPLWVHLIKGSKDRKEISVVTFFDHAKILMTKTALFGIKDVMLHQNEK